MAFDGTPFKYEYQCISQSDETVATGEFVLRMHCTIRGSEIVHKGIFGVFDNDRKRLESYRGQNHLKKIKMRVTNMITGSVRTVE